ncbi:MAG: chemotaxis protein CheA [Cytophagaceae bacterium]
MNQREKEYREIFMAEALEIYDSLCRLIVQLDKKPADEKTLAEVFRLLHNLKANSKAIGFQEIADISHKIETIFGAVRSHTLSFSGSIVTVLFDGIDLLGDLINNINNENFAGPKPEVLRNIDIILENISGNNIELHSVKKYYNNQNIVLSDLIYIRIKKLDDLLNMVGELIIDKDRLLAISKEIGRDDLMSVASHLHRVTNELQTSVMDARLVNIGTLFHKFPRVARDIAIVENKSVEMQIKGEDIMIDRNILQIITDSLHHIIRNAVNHGIEPVHIRRERSKPDHGTIQLFAYNDKDIVLIEIIDDGSGIDIEMVRRHAVSRGFISEERVHELNDREVLSFIFESGFSLSKEVNEFAGRGVGLDVVKNSIDMIGGKIEIESRKGQGTKFSLYIPTSMAVKGALLFEVNENSYALPLIHSSYVATIPTHEIHEIGKIMLLDIKTETIPVVDLRELFSSSLHEFRLGYKEILKGNSQNVIIVSYNNRKMGLIVDKMIRQQDIVVKALNLPVNNAELFAGVTLLGSGEVCLLLDIPSITKNITSKIRFQEVEL